jgi:sugar phosphate isomerase/epimerase
MRFGAMNFPVTPVLDEIDTFARLGFDYLELTMDPPLAHHTTLSSSCQRIVRALSDAGMGLVCHLPTFVTTADLTASLRRASAGEMRDSMMVAAELGARKVVLHPSLVSGMGVFVPDTVKEYAFAFFDQMAELARRLGITICLENMFPRNRLGVEPDDMAEMLDAFPDFQMTLDTGHANIGDTRGRRLKTLVERFAGRIAHVHASDNQGRIDDHMAVGLGTVRFADLMQRLRAAGYDDTITLEVFDTNRKMLVDSRERIKKMLVA